MYNPLNEVRRCPSGRSGVREKLYDYVDAAINLYGIISKWDLVEIFNLQNDEKTTVEELFVLLLPKARKGKWYCFYGDYIVPYYWFDDSRIFDYLISEQKGKPRYIPSKDEFLKYKNPYYMDERSSKLWLKVREITLDIWGVRASALKLQNYLLDSAFEGADIEAVTDMLEDSRLHFESNAQMEEFFKKYLDACNNSRLQIHKGHTPQEMMDMYLKKKPK